MTSYIQANTNGELHSAAEPSISPLDRGFLYGDAIYEVWRTFNGIVLAYEEHWQRLQRSARALGLPLCFTKPGLWKQIRRTALAFFRKTGSRPELYIRLQITRGAGAIGLNTRLADRPSYVILIQPLAPPSEEQVARGFKLALATALHRNHPSTLNPLWKTGNYLNNLLCLREAIARGADEVVMTNLAGEITESAVSNIFFVRDGVVVTPPLSAGILEGITRATVLGPVAELAGVVAREESIRPDVLASFQECFITGTTRGVHPVNAIDGLRFTVGPGTITARLRAAWQEHIRTYADKHHRLRVLPGSPRSAVRRRKRAKAKAPARS